MRKLSHREVLSLHMDKVVEVEVKKMKGIKMYFGGRANGTHWVGFGDCTHYLLLHKNYPRVKPAGYWVRNLGEASAGQFVSDPCDPH